jgi:hypothetical protein
VSDIMAALRRRRNGGIVSSTPGVTRDLAAFMTAAPYAPLATRAEVLEIPCSHCGAPAAQECATAFPRPAFVAGMVFGSALRGVHIRRYQDKTHDPR